MVQIIRKRYGLAYHFKILLKHNKGYVGANFLAVYEDYLVDALSNLYKVTVDKGDWKHLFIVSLPSYVTLEAI